MLTQNNIKPLRYASAREMPPLAVSQTDTRHNKTGDWRRLRPVFAERPSPCDQACPNGNGVREMLALAAQGRVDDALAGLRRASPLPGVCGRVCYHPCEAACNRAEHDEPLNVHALERFVADYGRPPAPARPEPTGRTIAVIGGGPAGLSCAYHLALLGHRPVLFEAQMELGGLLRYGIPSYRLPRHVLDREIELILAAGVEARPGQRFGTDFGPEDLAWFDGVFLAAGAQRSRRLDIPGESLPGAFSGLAFLRALASGETPHVGREVVVVGGGNTAVDSARAARRLGAAVTIVYRRSRADLPAMHEDIVAAEEEGIRWRFEAAPVRVVADDDRLAGVVFQPTRPGNRDGDRGPAPELAGPLFTLRAETLIVAIGEDIQTMSLPLEAPGTGSTSPPRTEGGAIWLAGGDYAGTLRRVVDAMGDGRRAAITMDHHFRAASTGEGGLLPAVRFDELNTEYFVVHPSARQPDAPVANRVLDFREVTGGLGCAEAAQEAARCFSCGSCTRCDNCWLFCPDIAVQRNPEGYSFDLDYCKGCGLCAVECPRAAIGMCEEASLC